MTNFGDVGQFNHKFGLPSVIHDGGPRQVDLEDEQVVERLSLKMTHMAEELEEYRDAYFDADVVGMADALVDLVYVALGAAHFLGLPWEQLWNEVHRANMKKERASAANPGVKRPDPGFNDVVKPPGFVPPDLRHVLEHFGWEL